MLRFLVKLGSPDEQARTVGADSLSLKKQQPSRIERNPPRLRLRVQLAPKFFGYVGLEVRRFSREWRGVQAQVKRHLMRRFAARH
jgi:hypothetical protein